MKKLLSSLFIVTLLTLSFSAFSASSNVQEIVELKKELQVQAAQLEDLQEKLESRIVLRKTAWTVTGVFVGLTALSGGISVYQLINAHSLRFYLPAALTFVAPGVVISAGCTITSGIITALEFKTKKDVEKFQQMVNHLQELLDAKIKALDEAETLELENL